MRKREIFCCIFLFLVLNVTQFKDVEGLLFSQFTLMQVVCCVSWPIPYKNPMRKLFFNVGFQFNYAEPFALTNFYKAPYFQNIFNSRDFKAKQLDKFNNSLHVDDKLQFDEKNDDTTEDAKSETITKPNEFEGRAESRSFHQGSNELAGRDLTAAQLYESIEDNFAEVGYDRSCLKKAICELARHPLHREDDEEHLLMDVINFMLTPTQHNGFAEHEVHDRNKYETAQKIGANGHDCNEIYSDCENSILNKFSYLLFQQ